MTTDPKFEDPGGVALSFVMLMKYFQNLQPEQLLLQIQTLVDVLTIDNLLGSAGYILYRSNSLLQLAVIKMFCFI